MVNVGGLSKGVTVKEYDGVFTLSLNSIVIVVAVKTSEKDGLIVNYALE